MTPANRTPNALALGTLVALSVVFLSWTTGFDFDIRGVQAFTTSLVAMLGFSGAAFIYANWDN